MKAALFAVLAAVLVLLAVGATAAAATVTVTAVAGGAAYSVRIAAQEAGGLWPLTRHVLKLAVGLVLFALVVLPGLWIQGGSQLLWAWLTD